MIAVVYGSSTLNTEYVAQRVVRAFGADKADLHNVKEIGVDLIVGRDRLVFVTSTWGAGDPQDDWERFIPRVETVDFTGKTVGLIGVGDQENYPENFCDSIGLLHDLVSGRGARVVGFTDNNGYNFRHSRALRDDRFVGLVLDEDNQSDKTDARIRAWVTSVRKPLTA